MIGELLSVMQKKMRSRMAGTSRFVVGIGVWCSATWFDWPVRPLSFCRVFCAIKKNRMCRLWEDIHELLFFKKEFAISLFSSYSIGAIDHDGSVKSGRAMGSSFRNDRRGWKSTAIVLLCWSRIERCGIFLCTVLLSTLYMRGMLHCSDASALEQLLSCPDLSISRIVCLILGTLKLRMMIM